MLQSKLVGTLKCATNCGWITSSGSSTPQSLSGQSWCFRSGAALAQDQLTKADLVQLAVTLGVYDNRCEKLAPRLLADVQRTVRMLDKDDVMAGVINEQEKVDRAGEAKWCDALRPVVEKYKNGLFEPTKP
jgi:hypothetical protein